MRKSMYVAQVDTGDAVEMLIVKARSNMGAEIETRKHYHPAKVQVKVFKPVAVLLVKERGGKDEGPLHS